MLHQTAHLSSLEYYRKQLMVAKILFMIIAILLMASATFSLASPLQKIETSPTRRLAQSDNNHHPRASMTCDVVPRVCRSAGNPGPDCCRKQCVNVETDAQNCGQCGKKCRYGEVCCRGSCVNVLFDPGNCGRCKNKCKKGGYCRHGMGNYA